MKPAQTPAVALSQSAAATSEPSAPPLCASATDVSILPPADTFVHRHIGPDDQQVHAMLAALGLSSLDELTQAVVPPSIRLTESMDLPGLETVRGEHAVLTELRRIAEMNDVFRSFIGQGYHGTITPPVIQRNILENPGWYTQYTPYQAEISQGRLEALVNFQTLITDLTAMQLANASLLDEATAAAEAMAMCHAIHEDRRRFFVADDCHPQTIAVVQTRGHSMGITIDVGPVDQLTDEALASLAGVLIQYPATDGQVLDHSRLTDRIHQAGSLLVVAADLLALTILKPPGEFDGGGADIVVGSTQRFGVPMGFGGPHAAYMATRMEFARKMPGRIVGISRDAQGNTAYRLAIQTREQHIRRDRATSNICTAQVLLAIIASMYAVYHGPQGLRAIACRVHRAARLLAQGLSRAGHTLATDRFFDTLAVKPKNATAAQIIAKAHQHHINLRDLGDGRVGITLDEPVTATEIVSLLTVFNAPADLADLSAALDKQPGIENRTSTYLAHPVFNTYHSEHELLRYIHRLQARDLSLTHSMIPLGSCTMKLNAAVEMYPVTWPQFANIHPFAPASQTRGYARMLRDLQTWLAKVTGFAAVSLQPNAGSQGEYAGLLTIRAYHAANNQSHRDICLIPVSAHGTNPATAVIAGMRVVAVACDAHGNVDLADLQAKVTEHAHKLAAMMITYPSTHGVFEPQITQAIDLVHAHGGQVYMDGANMNAQVGLTSPGKIGADVCHLNLHKTFCIPHGGGGPGMGPIACAAHLAPFLPAHPCDPLNLTGQSTGSTSTSTAQPAGPVSAAPFGSPMILPISWVYIALMGSAGLTRATQVAILNANYIAHQLRNHYNVVYRGINHLAPDQPGLVAHECIIDCRSFTKSANVSVEDIAKRLMDYGFHAPTMSFPVAGTLMIEPTESESKAELDRFCQAMITIRNEIRDIEAGSLDRSDNPLHGAPHTAAVVTSDTWTHPYTRQQAAFPAPFVAQHKFWPSVGRIDNPFGDRNLVCTCDPDWMA
jgi:glycine dehydrogenase